MLEGVDNVLGGEVDGGDVVGLVVDGLVDDADVGAAVDEPGEVVVAPGDVAGWTPGEVEPGCVVPVSELPTVVVDELP